MPNETAIVKIAKDKNTLQGFLQSPGALKTFGELDTSHLPAKKLAALACLAAVHNPKIFSCTLTSVAESVGTAVQLGLNFAGPLGEGYLVPYRNGKLSQQAGHEVYECKFMAGYRGLIRLVRRSGEVEDVDARVVYEKDEFELDYAAPNPIVKHVPVLEGDPGKIKGAYAIAWLRGSSRPKVKWMPMVQITKRRKVAKGDKIWGDWLEEMCQKTVIRSICNTLPLEVEASMALSEDDTAHNTLQEPEEIDADPTMSRTDQLAARLKNGNGATSDEHIMNGEEVPPDDPEEAAYLAAEDGD